MIEDMGDFGRTSVPPVPPPGETRPSLARSRARGVAAGVGVALVVGAGGIAVASSGGTTSGAAAAAPTTTEGAPPPAAGVPGGPGGHGGRMGGGPGIGFGGAVLHGTYVVAKSGGGYQTIQTQNGTVSAVSATSLSVKSADGYSFTYVVKAGTIVDAQSAGITSVKKGDTVTVNATVSGSTATIDRVMDVTLLKAAPNAGGGYGFPGGRPGGPGKGRGQQTSPSPTTSPGSTT